MSVLALIMAGGEGPGLGVLTARRTDAALPFAGKFRIIDFVLSNCVNSGITNVAVLTQYQPRSLNGSWTGTGLSLEFRLQPVLELTAPSLARTA